MVFNKEDKLYHETNNTCHICGKTFINKIRDHCDETGKNRGQQVKCVIWGTNNKTSFLECSTMALVLIAIYYIVNSLNRIMIKK